MKKILTFVLFLSLLCISPIVFASLGIGGGVIMPQATSTMLYQANVLLGITENIALDLQVVDFTGQVTDTYLIDPYVELKIPVASVIEVYIYGGVAPIFSYNQSKGFEFEDLYFAKAGGRSIISPLAIYGEGMWMMKLEEGGIGYSPNYSISVGAMLFFK